MPGYYGTGYFHQGFFHSRYWAAAGAEGDISIPHFFAFLGAGS
jgi:hypothetical protein